MASSLFPQLTTPRGSKLATGPLLSASNTTLVVVDVQEKLLPAISNRDLLVKNCGFLIEVSNLLAVPTVVTEQYPKGLGSTINDLKQRLQKSERFTKTAFSCCGASGFLDHLKATKRSHVVLVGMESHVCVSQTAFDLLEAGFHVYVAVDAVSSRFEIDHSTALNRLDRAGVILTTVETVAFEWLGDSQHTKFKDVSKLIIARS